jgi:hypothetical protein
VESPLIGADGGTQSASSNGSSLVSVKEMSGTKKGSTTIKCTSIMFIIILIIIIFFLLVHHPLRWHFQLLFYHPLSQMNNLQQLHQSN